MEKKKRFLGLAIIPILLLALTVFSSVSCLFFTYSTFYIPDAWAMLHWEATPYYSENWDFFVYFRIISLVYVALVASYLLINGFEREKSYPKNYILFMLSVIILFAIDVGYTYILPIEGLMSYGQIHGRMIFHSVVAAIFIPYFAFSKSVKEIFVK